MRSILLGFLLFCVWAVVGRWYYVCQIKGLCTMTEYADSVQLERPPTLALQAGDSLLFEGHQQFAFRHSSIQPILNFSNQNFIKQVVFHLQENNNQLLQVKGFYLESEKEVKSNFHENLGLARAEKIKQLLQDEGISAERLLIDSGIDDGYELLIEPLEFRITQEAVATAAE